MSLSYWCVWNIGKNIWKIFHIFVVFTSITVSEQMTCKAGRIKACLLFSSFFEFSVYYIVFYLSPFLTCIFYLKKMQWNVCISICLEHLLHLRNSHIRLWTTRWQSWISAAGTFKLHDVILKKYIKYHMPWLDKEFLLMNNV